MSLKRGHLALLIAAIAGGLLSPIASAHALTVDWAPAGWTNYYTGSSSAKSVTTKPSPYVSHPKNAMAQSTFIINYTNVPEIEKPAIQAAVDTWSTDWKSAVPVTINASFVRQASNSVLASATPVKFFHAFKGAPDSELWYPSAMANALAGKDLDPANPEIQININSTMARSLYLGTDGNCPPNQYDLESIILHELGHGLGFLSNDSYDTFFGFGSIDQPTPYDAYAQTPNGSRLSDLASPSLELGKALTNTLVWSGLNGIAANAGVKPLLYTPNPYQPGSSVSHLDQNTFSNSGANAVMCPSMNPAEIFHDPGPLLLAMMADMLLKPPAGVATSAPSAPRNVKALVSDKSAIITFDPPANARTAHVDMYSVKVNQTGQVVTGTESPISVTGLRNGGNYSFSITAANTQFGSSPAATTNNVVPQATWKSTVLDPTSDGKYLATSTYGGKPIVVYTDTKSGYLKMATFDGKKWSQVVIDGNSNTGGKTTDDVSGALSLCSSKVGKSEILNIFYSDLKEKDLRHAAYDGKKWSFEVVDGNGTAINDYKDPVRVRTSSDVSKSNACVVTTGGLQVFYRDESQGILLGATKVAGTWNYELVDGDRDTNGRTTGDVGFHLKALNVGNTVYVLYDSILQVNQDKVPTRGEIRLATRSTIYPEDWTYSTPDPAGDGTTIAGYDVAISVNKGVFSASWLASSGITIPNADQIRWATLTSNPVIANTPSDFFGTPGPAIATDGTRILFTCQTRLCSANSQTKGISLISTLDFSNSAGYSWITLAGQQYALAGVNGALRLFKQ
jgi:Fibronectin type III domain